ncbi:MAG: hypothetical protein FJ161_05065, partial [Gammaproteobacteria bacterium]|nr:hypothetical protein [Gammaproteobacteria bacterium]
MNKLNKDKDHNESRELILWLINTQPLDKEKKETICSEAKQYCQDATEKEQKELFEAIIKTQDWDLIDRTAAFFNKIAFEDKKIIVRDVYFLLRNSEEALNKAEKTLEDFQSEHETVKQQLINMYKPKGKEITFEEVLELRYKSTFKLDNRQLVNDLWNRYDSYNAQEAQYIVLRDAAQEKYNTTKAQYLLSENEIFRVVQEKHQTLNVDILSLINAYQSFLNIQDQIKNMDVDLEDFPDGLDNPLKVYLDGKMNSNPSELVNFLIDLQHTSAEAYEIFPSVQKEAISYWMSSDIQKDSRKLIDVMRNLSSENQIVFLNMIEDPGVFEEVYIAYRQQSAALEENEDSNLRQSIALFKKSNEPKSYASSDHGEEIANMRKYMDTYSSEELQYRKVYLKNEEFVENPNSLTENDIEILLKLPLNEDDPCIKTRDDLLVKYIDRLYTKIVENGQAMTPEEARLITIYSNHFQEIAKSEKCQALIQKELNNLVKKITSIQSNSLSDINSTPAIINTLKEHPFYNSVGSRYMTGVLTMHDAFLNDYVFSEDAADAEDQYNKYIEAVANQMASCHAVNGQSPGINSIFARKLNAYPGLKDALVASEKYNTIREYAQNHPDLLSAMGLKTADESPQPNDTKPKYNFPLINFILNLLRVLFRIRSGSYEKQIRNSVIVPRSSSVAAAPA